MNASISARRNRIALPSLTNGIRRLRTQLRMVLTDRRRTAAVSRILSNAEDGITGGSLNLDTGSVSSFGDANQNQAGGKLKPRISSPSSNSGLGL
jgi:hypothetical protein